MPKKVSAMPSLTHQTRRTLLLVHRCSPSAPRLRRLPVPSQGRTNQVFSKPCLFLSDTRHFRHFRRFRGSEERSPCFHWVECKFVIFAVFVKTAPFWQGTKTRFTKNTVCATPTKQSDTADLVRLGAGTLSRGNRRAVS